jgi:hypothetical protein
MVNVYVSLTRNLYKGVCNPGRLRSRWAKLHNKAMFLRKQKPGFAKKGEKSPGIRA